MIVHFHKRRTRAPCAIDDGYDWFAIQSSLNIDGYAVLKGALEERDCDTVKKLYDQEQYFRSRVTMARHGFGSGEYKYFRYPLPDTVSAARASFYPRLAVIANLWNRLCNKNFSYPAQLDIFLAECDAAGQNRPTPLILKYGEGDFNCLHQDLYGEIHFPLQVAILLSEPGIDFVGGEFVLTQKSNADYSATAFSLHKGDAIIFSVNSRPTPGRRGFRQCLMRHGVSQIFRGDRYALGIIFHDAR